MSSDTTRSRLFRRMRAELVPETHVVRVGFEFIPSHIGPCFFSVWCLRRSFCIRPESLARKVSNLEVGVHTQETLQTEASVAVDDMQILGGITRDEQTDHIKAAEAVSSVWPLEYNEVRQLLCVFTPSVICCPETVADAAHARL